MIWEKKDVDNNDVKTLAKQYNLDLLTASIFVRRGLLEPEELCYFLESDVRFLHNPYHFEEMPEAVQRINLAIEQNEKILIFGDRDVDGITSTVMMVETLRELGADVSWGLPIGDESYGLTNEVINKAAADGVKLLITVDCGISNIDEIELAGEKDIDAIVVDHHNPHEYLPDAIAVINPKLEDTAYPFRDICGCAVTAKVIWALIFSRTKYFQRPICLLNIRPANQSYAIETVKLMNLVETDRLVENVVPGVIPFERCRTREFIEGNTLFVYNKETQELQFGKVFGEVEHPEFVDLAPGIIKSFPPLEGKSLLKIKELSKLAKYSASGLSEIEMLKNLVISYVLKTETSLNDVLMDKLGYVALGTLADIMPLINENRVFVKIGLHALNKSNSQGLRQLLYKQDLFNRKISSRDVSWNISPVINATGRMGEPNKAAELLLSKDRQEIDTLVEYILGLNKKRKSLGDRVWRTMLSKAHTSHETTEGKMVLIAGKAIHRGITGIIAARLVNYFKTSAVVVAVLEDKAVGSMRSTPDMNAKNFLHNFGDIFVDFGGHDMAAGFSLPLDKLEEFQERFYKVVAELEPGETKEEKINIDAEIPLSYMTQDLWNVVERFEPYGECNLPLYFLSRGLKILSLDLIGKANSDHVKMLMDTGKTKWPAIMWNGAERVKKDFDENDTVDIVYHVNKNFFQNTESLRLTIIDIKRRG